MLARIRLSVSRLVDGLGGPALSNAALLIEGDRIAEVGVEASVPRASGPYYRRSGVMRPRHRRAADAGP